MKLGVILTFLDLWDLFCRFVTRRPTFLETSFSYLYLLNFYYHKATKQSYHWRPPLRQPLERALNVAIPSTLKGALNVDVTSTLKEGSKRRHSVNPKRGLWTSTLHQPLKRALNVTDLSTLKGGSERRYHVNPKWALNEKTIVNPQEGTERLHYVNPKWVINENMTPTPKKGFERKKTSYRDLSWKGLQVQDPLHIFIN